MKFNKDLLEKRWVAYTIAACSAVILYFLLSNLGDIFKGMKVVYKIFSPLITGLIIAYIIDPFVTFLRETVFVNVKNEKTRKSLSVTTALVGIAIIIILLMVALIPQIVVSIKTLFGNMDTYIRSLQHFLQTASMEAAKNNIDISGIASFGDDILNFVSKKIPENFDGILNTSLSISKAIFDLFIAMFLAIYFLADKDRLRNSFRRLLKRLIKADKYKVFAGFWERCNSILIRYIAFDIIDGIIVGVANFIFMSIMGMPYPVLISLVVGVTNLAPTFGPIVGAIIGGFVLVLVNPLHALWFIIFTIILQTIDGYILKPKLFGGSLGVPGVWILISIIIGSRILGVTGILIAIPFAAIVDFIYHDIIFQEARKREELEKQK
ncbi:MAG: AI-2E family transporter [Catonella sp.]|uniref:AI-2E family transporter n=1 Tax=Catonella sp. TaxID=2382125 RepID=UPI003FA03D04